MEQPFSNLKDPAQTLQKHLRETLAKNQQLTINTQPNIHEHELVSIKNKEKSKESAVASSAVKKHLQKFVIDRQKSKIMDNYAQAAAAQGISPYMPGSEVNTNGNNAHLNKRCAFPLRKTNSEPNLKVRTRIRQMINLRDSPLMSRRNQQFRMMRRQMVSDISENGTHNPAAEPANTSNPSSPPARAIERKAGVALKRTESGTLPFNGAKDSQEAPAQPDLYSSPSLPNLPLGLQRRALLNREGAKDGAGRGINYPDGSRLNQSYNAPGPIRNKPFNNRHSRLGRTHSAPGGQNLQQHLLNKQLKLLRSKMQDYPNYFDQGQAQNPTLPTNQPTSSNLAAQINAQIKPFSLNPIAAMPWVGYPLNPALSYPHLALYQQMAPALQNFQNIEMINQTINSIAQKQQASRGDSNDSLPVTETTVSEKADSSKPSSSTSSISELPQNLEVSKPAEKPSDQPTIPAQLHNKHIEKVHKPLSRTKSSPLPTFPLVPRHAVSKKTYRYTTGVAYSPIMLQHGCSCNDSSNHIETSIRLRTIWKYLKSRKIVEDVNESDCSSGSKCEMVQPRKATTDELMLVHTKDHTLCYGTTSLARKEFNTNSKFIVLSCGGIGVDNGVDQGTVWNEQKTIDAARMAVGCTIDLAKEVALGKLKNGFSIVRPPGHHAEEDVAMAFCYFNNVAIAVKSLIKNDLARKVLIIDWDAHHCNGTQKIFYDSDKVMVISVHRYDNGKFFPGTGSCQDVGTGAGAGFNVNIPLDGGSTPAMGDKEYLAVFRSVVMPIAQQFNPDFVFISCGFSAARGHPDFLAGFDVTPQCFGYLTYMVSQLAKGKLVMVLEGGFEENALCHSTEACIETMLGSKNFSNISNSSLNTRPLLSAVNNIKSVIAVHSCFWKGLDSRFGEMSHMDYLKASNDNDTCEAMAQLSVNNKQKSQNVGKHENNVVMSDNDQNTDIEIEL